MTECVYRHTAPDGRMYIGIAQEPPHIRWAKGKGYKSNPEFWRCICEVGWENIEHEVLFSGLDRRDALKIESELIEKYGSLAPNGFNRRRDDGHSYVRCKVEVGRKYGYCEVLNYWPDENRMKEYKMRCSCGKVFVCKWSQITDDLMCDDCEERSKHEKESRTGSRSCTADRRERPDAGVPVDGKAGGGERRDEAFPE